MIRWLYFSCALAATICFCLLFLTLNRTLSTLNRDASTLETSLNRFNGTLNAVNQAVSDPANGLQANLVDLHRTLLVAGGAITNIEKGTRAWQKKQNAIADQALADEKSLNLALQSLGATANSLSSLTEAQKSNLSNLENQASSSLTQMAALSDTLQSEITPALRSFAQAGANTAAGTATADSILAHGDHIAAHYDKEITGPVSKARAISRAVSGAVGSFVHSVLF